MKQQEILSGSRMERKKEETKRKVIAVATRLFKEKGFGATTMEQIAREADIAKGTLYNYFPVKEAIVDEYIKLSFREQNSARIRQVQKLPDTRTRLIHIFNELIAGVRAQKDLFEKYLIYRMQLLVSFNQDDSEKSGFYLIAREIIALGQQSGEIRADLAASVMVELFEFAFIEAVKLFYMEPEKFDAGEVIGRYADLCLNGIKQSQSS